MARFRFLPCLDSDEMAASRKLTSWIDRDLARSLGERAVVAAEDGFYFLEDGSKVAWRTQVERARASRISIAPEAPLPLHVVEPVEETVIQVANKTTLQAGRELVDAGHRPLALNFANGITPGGGFLSGARAQEEGLCRSSALFVTLQNDAMYQFHRARPRPDSTEWCIVSPDVPVFRGDAGNALKETWLLSFITSAAPYAPSIGQPESGDLLKKRIRRVLAIASAYGYKALVLGAWGCGAFGNDPQRTAEDFHEILTTEFCGHFSNIVFAITDWSPERRMLGPFRDVFQ
mgnify:FL=1|jgi:uncharacterized protein (TIGR02452 family)